MALLPVVFCNKKIENRYKYMLNVFVGLLAGLYICIVKPEIIENFYQIFASIFLASYEIHDTYLTCRWLIHHNTTV